LICQHFSLSLYDLCRYEVDDWTQTLTTGLGSVVLIGDANSGISPVSLSQLLASKFGMSFDPTSYACSSGANQKNNNFLLDLRAGLLLLAFGFLDDALERVDTRVGVADTSESSGSPC
jgi:hypothetical protein